jgi:hypothetical protein
VETKYRDCGISITAPILNHESMEWHCDICLTIHAEDDIDIRKGTHTFAVNSQDEALVAAVSLAKEQLDSMLP